MPTVLHLFSGMGGGALGFRRAGFVSVGAFDVDAGACRDLERLTGERATVADLGELTPAQLRNGCTGRPDVVFTSPPCKGFSGCLPTARARSDRYLQLNSLAMRGIWLALEAWEQPPPLIVFENVPRILQRGRAWIEQITKLLYAYGYAVDISTHDCGEFGGLAQRRRRMLLVARHLEQVPEFLRRPPVQRVRAVGEVLGELPTPLPGSDAGGNLHVLPRLSPLNWVRLALIRAGRDWRDLPPAVAWDPHPGRHAGKLGVQRWDAPGKTVIARARACSTWASVQDPRIAFEPYRGSYGVQDWASRAPTVKGALRTSNACGSVADPRIASAPRSGVYGVEDWGAPAATVLGRHRHDNARGSVADPRVTCAPYPHVWGVQPWAEPSTTIRGNTTIHSCRAAVDDPRIGAQSSARWAGHERRGDPRPASYGVQPWEGPAHVVRGVQRVQTTRASVADPRGRAVPTHAIRLRCLADLRFEPAIVGPRLDLDSAKPVHLVIVAADGSWHRPLTTLELAVLQGFPARAGDGWLELDGRSHQRYREKIGNAVPPGAAEAIARECAETLARARTGRRTRGGRPVWVERASEVQP